MKAILGFIFILSSLSVFAQSRDGRISLRDGNSTVRIIVGNNNNNDNQQLSRRVRMLEEAVRDLQGQVYDLRDQPTSRVVKTHVCSLQTSFDGAFIGKAQTRIEAEAIARNNCSNAGVAFCSSTRVECDQIEEVVYH